MKDNNTKSTARLRADEIKEFRCKNLIAVIENPTDIKNIGTIIRNVNTLGVEKAYVIDRVGFLCGSRIAWACKSFQCDYRHESWPKD